MDPKFQSSFIPRKSAVDTALPSRAAVGVFTLVCIAVFVVAAALTGVLFLWKQSTVSANDNLAAQLKVYQQKLDDPNIQELIRLNDRIATAKSRLEKHTAVSNLFSVLNETTLQNIQWTSFSFETNPTAGFTIFMNGQAKGFADVALQSDKILADTRFVTPLFSDVSLADTNAVNFSLRSGIAPQVVSYRELMRGREDMIVEFTEPVEVEISTTTIQIP